MNLKLEFFFIPLEIILIITQRIISIVNPKIKLLYK